MMDERKTVCIWEEWAALARKEMWEKMRRYCIYARRASPPRCYRDWSGAEYWVSSPSGANCTKRRGRPCEYENCPLLKEG